MALKDNLKLMREEAGYHYAKDFAKAAGIPYSSYSMYERKGWPNEKTLVKIASMLRISIDCLLDYHIPDETEISQISEKDDVISHPSHYTQGIECMDYIESHKLNYARGNVIKYVTRAGLKDASKEVEDLEKARWYLDREIERVKKAKKDG